MTSGKSHNPGWEGVGPLAWARAFLVLTLGAALLGLGRLAVTSVGIAQALFVSFLAAFLVALILGLVGGLKMTTGARHDRFPVAPNSAVIHPRGAPQQGEDLRPAPGLKDPRGQASRRA
ncbi:MAG: DUF1328 family protein [Gemmatimonadales bacterium]